MSTCRNTEAESANQTIAEAGNPSELGEETHGYKVELLETHILVETEEHDDRHASALATQMALVGVWLVPILVERQDLLVMDGHHRLAAARKLRLHRIPVVRLSYGDHRLTLTSWRTDFHVTPALIKERARSGLLFPHKTTRHTVAPALPVIHISLQDLKGTQ